MCRRDPCSSGHLPHSFKAEPYFETGRTLETQEKMKTAEFKDNTPTQYWRPRNPLEKNGHVSKSGDTKTVVFSLFPIKCQPTPTPHFEKLKKNSPKETQKALLGDRHQRVPFKQGFFGSSYQSSYLWMVAKSRNRTTEWVSERWCKMDFVHPH